jgi:hypothetical protein
VIHQKNKLTRNQPQKLWPLLRAMLAGSKARATQATTTSMNQNTLNVTPRNVVANMIIPSDYYILTVSHDAYDYCDYSHDISDDIIDTNICDRRCH